MSFENIKISKSLRSSVANAGYLTPKEVQVKTISRIIGGQDITVIGPEGCGKTTTYVLGILSKIKYTSDEAPRALVLVADKEKVEEVVERFNLLNTNENIRIVGVYPDGGMEGQINELTDGVDIVVSVPSRARAIYLKLGLNLNKLEMFVVDDADLIIKNGMQLPVVELANSAQKCQHLVFSEVNHDKLQHMISPFMQFPALIEVKELANQSIEIYPQILYKVVNFKTKLNLIRLLLNDEDFFTKAIVFVNTRLTAQKVLDFLKHSNDVAISVFKPLFFDQEGFDHVEDFKQSPEARILIVANEGLVDFNCEGVPYVFHLELPEEKELYLSRIQKKSNEDVLFFSFATDIELTTVAKIEQLVGTTFEVAELPEGLKIETQSKEKAKLKTSKITIAEEQTNSAFHQKKASNSKTYNYGIGQKAIMNKKKKHG